MSAPVWLADEVGIRALLDVVVNRFDERSGELRAKAIVMPLVRYLPELVGNGMAADQTWAFIVELQRLGVLSIRPGRRGAYDSPWENASVAFAPACEGMLRQWLERPAEPSTMQRWRDAVEAHAGQFPGGYAALLARRIHVEGRTPEEVVAALSGLSRIDGSATLRQLSTAAFWGDSKVLDDRGELIATLFPGLPLRERPIVVAVYLPEQIDGTLFIENQDTYTCAVAGEPRMTRHYGLVYMAGFRGAALRIRAPDGACLHFAGPGIVNAGQFERCWFGADAFVGPMSFWGDLDFSGMQILKSLRERFGGVSAWQPGYEPMLRDLRRCSRPHRERLDGQVDPGFTGCSFADNELLPAIRDLGFWHQERIGYSRE